MSNVCKSLGILINATFFFFDHKKNPSNDWFHIKIDEKQKKKKTKLDNYLKSNYMYKNLHAWISYQNQIHV